MELDFEDVSTFDAENPIVGSLLREIDLNKKQTDSDFIKSLPTQPGKEFEIKKRLDRLRDKKKPSRKKTTIIMVIITTTMEGIYFPQALETMEIYFLQDLELD